MRIHILSDLHNEIGGYTPEAVEADLVILAGDIHSEGRGVAWARDSFPGRVLYVPGNHEFYDGHIDDTLSEMRQVSCERVMIMDLDQIIIDGVRFLGATTWTDYRLFGDPDLSSMAAWDRMNDFEKIRIDAGRRIRPQDISDRATKAKAWLKSKLNEHYDGKTVVISHHLPVINSLQERGHDQDGLAPAYANDWRDLIHGEKVDLWIHGHAHFSVDYELNGTRIICNPRGYPREETNFDPQLVIEI